jgi:hypothetical protein
VLSEGEIKVSDKITLRRVALVQSLGYNLLSLSQLLDEGFEVLFRPGGSRILDSRGDLVCMVVPEGEVFRADFSQSSGVERCFVLIFLSLAVMRMSGKVPFWPEHCLAHVCTNKTTAQHP